MLKKLLILMMLVSCGPKHDCPDCPDNPSEPTPPPPNPEPTDKVVKCNLKWELEGEPEGRFFNIEYIVIYKTNKETHATLKTSYEYSGQVIEGAEANKIHAADKANMAEVNTLVWQASLTGNIAKIKNNALNDTKEVTCI